MVATYFKQGRGKSLRAIEVENNFGYFPITRATQIIYNKIKPYFKITKKQIKLWLEQIGSCEAHHVGKYAILVDYYDTAPILEGLFLLEESFDDINGEPIFFNEFLLFYE